MLTIKVNFYFILDFSLEVYYIRNRGEGRFFDLDGNNHFGESDVF